MFKKKINETALLTIDSILQIALQIAFLSVTSRYVAPEYYAPFSLALIIVNIFRNLGLSGISLLILKNKNADNALDVLIAVGLISFLIALPLGLLNENIANFLGSPESSAPILLISLSLILTTSALVFEAFLIKIEKIKIYILCNAITFLVNILSFYVFMQLVDAPGYVWLTYSFVASSLFRLAFLVIISHREMRIKLKSWNLQVKNIKLTLSQLANVSSVAVVNSMALNVDTLIVSKYLGQSALGIYSRAYQINNYGSSIYSKVISKIGVKSYSECLTELDIKENFSKIFKITAIIGVLLSLGIHTNADLITDVLFGSMWKDLAEPMEVLSLALVFRLIYKSIDTYLLVFNHIRTAVVLQVMMLINIFVVALIFVDYGLLAICYAILFVSLIQCVVSVCTALIRYKLISAIDLKNSLKTPVALLIIYCTIDLLIKFIISGFSVELNNIVNVFFSFLELLLVVAFGYEIHKRNKI